MNGYTIGSGRTYEDCVADVGTAPTPACEPLSSLVEHQLRCALEVERLTQQVLRARINLLQDRLRALEAADDCRGVWRDVRVDRVERDESLAA